MAAVTSYSRTASSNTSSPPDGAPEGMAAGAVNNVIREIMKGVVDEATYNACKVLASVAGTNTITASLSPDITAYSAGMMVVITPAVTNTGATTLNIDSLGALDIFNIDGTACIGGELVAGLPALLVLDAGADDWVVVNPASARNAGFSNCSTPYTTLSTDRGRIKQLIISGANTLTIDASLTDARFRFFNSTGSTTTVNVNSGTLSFYNGTQPPATGARSLAGGGVADILVIGGGITYISGWGIT